MIKPGLRPSVRLRLTLLYGGLFLLAGAAFLGVTYLLVKDRPVVEVTSPGVVGVRQTDQAPVGKPLSFGEFVRAEAVTVRERREALQSLLVRGGIALALTSAGALALGWLMAGRVLRPIQQLTATARRLSEQTLDERIRLKGPNDELKELADTFDAMLDRLDMAFASHRRFIANAAHELRTPLTLERTMIDVALADDATRTELRSVLAKLRQVTQYNERIIDGLLTLAVSSRGLQRRDPVDLAAIANQVLRRVEDEARSQGLRVTSSLEQVEVLGDAVLLERMVANLIENAVRYNQPGGWAQLSTGYDGERAVITVTNAGRRIPAEAVPSLFEPFRRLDNDRTSSSDGVGLGLSIVKAVALAHGGNALATARDKGGLEVTVILPRLRRR